MSLADHRRNISNTIASINKGSKYKAIVSAEHAPNPHSLRRPSGIPQLDINTAGGAPAGGITVISGPDNAGKTFLLYKYFSMCQKIYGEYSSILYAAVEFIPDYFFMRKIGCQVAIPDDMLDAVDQDRAFRRLPKMTKQQRAEAKKEVGTFHVLRRETAEELLDDIIRCYKSNAFKIIAIDSISIIQSSAEAGLDSLEDNPQQAANASLITRFMQRLHPLCRGLGEEAPNDTSLFATAQVRANRKKTEAPSYIAKYLKDWSTAQGANALKHGKLVDIQLWADGKEAVGKGDDKKIIGKTMHWTITKQKAGGHDNVSGEYTYLYDTPGDHLPALIATCIKYGTAQEIEGKLTFFNSAGEVLLSPSDKPLKEINGIQELRGLLSAEPEAELMVMRELAAAAGVENPIIYRRKGED